MAIKKKIRSETKAFYPIMLVTFLLSIFTIIPFYKNLVDNQGLYVLKYVSFALFLVVLITYYYKSKIKPNNILIICLIIFFGFFSFYNLESQTIADTSIYFIIGLCLAICSGILFTGFNEYVFFKIIWVMLISLSACVLIPSLVESQQSDAYYISTEGRLRFDGIFNNANELARFCLLSLLLGLRMFTVTISKKQNMFLFFIIISSIYVIYLSNSRTSMTIAILGIIGYLWIGAFFKSRNTTLWVTYSVIGCLLVISIPFLLNTYYQLGFEGIDKLLSGRLGSWQPILNQGFMNLFFGTGTEREGLASTIVLVNGYIEIIKYLGLLGLLSWTALITYNIYRKIESIRKFPTKRNVQGLFIIFLFLIYYLFEGGLLSIGNLASIYFWLEISHRPVIEYYPDTKNIKKRGKRFNNRNESYYTQNNHSTK